MQNLKSMIAFLLLSSASISTSAATNEQDQKLRSLEGRWNTALISTYTANDKFMMLGQEVAIIDYFRWSRCENGVMFAGAHPTLRGGTDKAYKIAERILAFVNFDRTGDEPAILLSDIHVPCTLNQ